MTLRKALLAATVLSLPMVAQAQPVTGLYVGAGAGLNFRQDSDLTPSSSLRSASATAAFRDPGAVGLGAIGWGFGNGLRAEIEGNYRYNEVQTISNTRSPGGYTQTYGVMANALFDFSLGLPITPYIGAGVGYAWSEVSKGRASSTLGNLRIDDTDGQFAYQGILGAAYNLGAMMPGLAVTAEYRFYGTLEGSYKATNTAGSTTRAGTVDATNYNHSVLVGLRYAFNAPRPAPQLVTPPAPPPPAVARTYLVFFDWDKADLTDRARQIITEAAGASRRVTTTKIEVAGHADRSGTPQYNQRLSERRAQAVAAELVRQGVARNDIAITAFGESKPLVPTADGVREPQNRRVEIVLR